MNAASERRNPEKRGALMPSPAPWKVDNDSWARLIAAAPGMEAELERYGFRMVIDVSEYGSMECTPVVFRTGAGRGEVEKEVGEGKWEPIDGIRAHRIRNLLAEVENLLLEDER